MKFLGVSKGSLPIRLIESTPEGIHPTIKDRYERRRVTYLIPFSDWQPTMDDAIAAVPALWLLPRYAKLVVLQRCNLCGVWSYRYVVRALISS